MRRQDARSNLLDDDARLEEIARMLSGAAVTDEARAAAKRLMAEARDAARRRRANGHERQKPVDKLTSAEAEKELDRLAARNRRA